MGTEAGIHTGTAAIRSGAKPVAGTVAEPPFDHIWDLAPGESTPCSAPGDRHADWTVAAMLEDAIFDQLAIADGRIRGLVVGCGEGWIAHRLLEWGVESVLGVDEREVAIRRALMLRDRFAIRPTELAIHRAAPDELEPSSLGAFDVVVVSRQVQDRDAALRLARDCGARLCAIESTDRLADLDRARAAGYSRVSLAQAPTDAERRVVLLERALLLARGGREP